MVFNAAASCPTMMTMFEDYTWQHYTYLRESLPDLVPELQVSLSGNITLTYEKDWLI